MVSGKLFPTVLHALINVFHADWSVDCGGMRVYVAKDEEEEVCHTYIYVYAIVPRKMYSTLDDIS